MPDLLETAELLAFVKTVDAKSLSRAAAELTVPRATISRRLARLEERLGVRLLRRTTRSLALTDAGEALYRHARIVLEDVGRAEASVRREDGAMRGDLRVSVPPTVSESFHEMICGFAKQYPDVRLQIHFASRHVDLLRERYDVAIRAGSEIEPGLVARTLARDPVIAVAAPEYLDAYGTPRTRRELRHHRCLTRFARDELPQTHWSVGKGKLAVASAFASNDITLLCEAALHGLGIAFLPRVFVRPYLESGELVHVLAGTVGADSRIAVVYVERQFISPHVRAFVERVTVWGKTEYASGFPARFHDAARTRRARVDTSKTAASRRPHSARR